MVPTMRADAHYERRSAPRLALVLSWVVVGVGLLAHPGQPLAAPGGASTTDKKPKTATQDRAQKAFQEAQDLYREGKYRAAVDKLVEARKLDPTDKDLPYNLGLVNEKLGNLDDAIKNFELFLTLETDDAEKERVKGIIRRLEGARTSAPKPTVSAPAASSAPPVASSPPIASSGPEPETPPPTKGRLDGLVIGAGAVSIVALGAGTFFGIRALSTRPSSPVTGQNHTVGQYMDDAKSAHQKAQIADVSFAVALLAGGAAAFLYFSRDAEPAAPATAGFVLPLQGGFLGGMSGRF
jgi:tetratricopeptide (TPR) repeat protein